MRVLLLSLSIFFFFQAEDGIRYHCVTGVQTCALPICLRDSLRSARAERSESRRRTRPAPSRPPPHRPYASPFPPPRCAPIFAQCPPVKPSLERPGPRRVRGVAGREAGGARRPLPGRRRSGSRG